MKWSFLGVVLFMLWQAGAASLVAEAAGDEIKADFAPLSAVFR